MNQPAPTTWTARVTVYRRDTVWTDFEVTTPSQLAARLFQWQAEPGCDRIRVEDATDATEWRRR
jgi:hypothetical protein